MTDLQTYPGQAAVKSTGVIGGVFSILSGISVLLVYFGVLPFDLVGILGGSGIISGIASTYGRIMATKKITTVLPKQGD